MTDDLFREIPKAMPARDYQEAAITATLDKWKTNRHLIGCMATGGGKTFVFSNIISRMQPCRTIILAHMNELCGQIYRALEMVGIRAEIEKAEERAQRYGWDRPSTVIATPQTLYSRDGSRLKSFKPTDFDLLIIDEIHHYVSPGFKKCVQYFQANPNLKTLGVTATPDRHDNESLKQIIEGVAFDIEMDYLIKQGWLVKPLAAMAKLRGYDLSDCHTTAGDFNGRELANVLEKDAILLCMADEIVKRTDGKRTLVFCHRVEQAERMAVYLNNHKPNSADCVFGHTPIEVRKDIFARFENGQLEKLINVGVATEAYDNPNIEWVAMCRPTLSRTLFCQMLGRGTRVATGVLTPEMVTPEQRLAAIAGSFKPKINVLDFVGNTGRHSVIRCEDILGGNVSEEARRVAAKRIEEKGGGDVLDELAIAEIEAKKKAEAERLAGLKVKADYEIHYVDPFDAFSKRAEKWRGYTQTRPLTDKQRKTLIQHGYNPDDITPQEGQAIITRLFSATEPQMKVLLKAGYSKEELEGIHKWEATKLIQACKENHWKRPQPTNTHA